MPDGLLRVGLTGGIATGKSYVTRRLRDASIPTIDADQLSRDVVARNTPGLSAVVARFGPHVLTADGDLDRQALGAIVFADASARRDLEAIVHPEVRRRTADWQRSLAEAGHRGPIVADIPLLFEGGREVDFDVVVVVACDAQRQRERLMARDGISEEAADRRLAAQWPIAEKVARADYVVRTDGTFADTDVQVDRLIETLTQRASAVGS
ncbi:MAG TPA: dephospho-CoA kinase [Luteitalea sp.]|nr:dephospho-CoA kinase [Luteitalea sp.]